MDQLGCKRYCCRRMIMTHVDLIEKLLKYATSIQWQLLYYGRLRLLTAEIDTILRSETRRKLPWLEKGLALHGTGVYGGRISNTSIVGARREGSSLGRQILQSDRKRRDFQISFMHHLATLRAGHAHIHRQSLDRKHSQPDGLSSSAAVGSQQTQGLNVLCFS
jgi:hypothetical protein